MAQLSQIYLAENIVSLNQPIFRAKPHHKSAALGPTAMLMSWWSHPSYGPDLRRESCPLKKTFNSRSKGLERASILFFHSPYSLNAPKRALKLAIWHQLAVNNLSFRQRARTLLRGLCRIWTKDYPEFIYNTYACMSWKITIPINQRQLSHTDVFSWSG